MSEPWPRALGAENDDESELCRESLRDSRITKASVPPMVAARNSSPPLLCRRFCERPADVLARQLLGHLLRLGPVTIRITETEAYLGPDDTAAHSRMGPTPRNAPTWGPAGYAYVYLCYGLHQLLNVVAGPPGSAVLIRAAEPVNGESTIRRRRGGKKGPVLLTGPGKVGQALGLDSTYNGHPLSEVGGLELRRGAGVREMLVGPRVGIEYASVADRKAPLRFAMDGSVWVSHPAGLRRDRSLAVE